MFLGFGAAMVTGQTITVDGGIDALEHEREAALPTSASGQGDDSVPGVTPCSYQNVSTASAPKVKLLHYSC